MKKNIAVIFGGESVEHDVSIISGMQVVENIDSNKFTVYPIYIDKNGQWYNDKKLFDINTYKQFEKKSSKIKKTYPSNTPKDKFFNNLDCAVICCHGNYGENGTLQGLLDHLKIPYTSSGTLGSSSGMDKIVMKQIFKGLELPVLPFKWFESKGWLSNRNSIISMIEELTYPVIVKPSNLGSSIGIGIAGDQTALVNAIETALCYDQRIIVEKAIESARDINCSAMKRSEEIITSPTEEPVKIETLLSFSDKYLRNRSKSGMKGMSRKMPADIPERTAEDVAIYTKKIYRVMDCNGIVRVDYLYDDKNKNIFVNEINTIPGSLSFYMWEQTGISFQELIEIIIEESISAFNRKKTLLKKFDSDLINKPYGSIKK